MRAKYSPWLNHLKETNMKKLLIALSLVAQVAVAQDYNQLSFLNVQALSVTNTGGYTNNQPYFGWSPITSTNTTGLRYTNNSGTYVLVAASNAVSGLVSVSNGVAFSTNDVTAISKDIRFHSDRNGNVCTNYVLSMAALYNSTSTGGLVCVYAPIVGVDGTGPNSGITLLDLANTATVAFPVLRGGATNSCVAVDWSKYAGYWGMRLISAGLTNSFGQAWIFDNSVPTYVP